MNVAKHLGRIPCLVSIRMYSQYPKNAIYPLTKDKYYEAAVAAEQIDLLKKLPIRAAHVTESSSALNDYTTLKFVNMIMRDGKKQLARKQVMHTFYVIKKIQVQSFNNCTDEAEKATIILDPLRLLKMAINNGRPLLKLQPLRRGGAIYQVPVPITNRESIFRSMKWLIEAGNDKDGSVPFEVKLAAEILDAAFNRGRVIKKKIELHKICEANRAYAHFRWG